MLPQEIVENLGVNTPVGSILVKFYCDAIDTLTIRLHNLGIN